MRLTKMGLMLVVLIVLAVAARVGGGSQRSGQVAARPTAAALGFTE